MKQLTALLLIIGISIPASFAQENATAKEIDQIAYVDINYVFNNLPEAKKIEKSVAEFEKQLYAQYSKVAGEFEKKQRELDSLAQSGNLPLSVQQDRVAELKSLQARLVQMEQTIPQEIEQKKNKELEPAFNKIKAAIKVVADEKGYDYVLNGSRDDQSIIILYARDKNDDISDAVLQHLGVDPSTASKKANSESPAAGSGIPLRK